jgi:hypothetical protein
MKREWKRVRGKNTWQYWPRGRGVVNTASQLDCNRLNLSSSQ